MNHRNAGILAIVGAVILCGYPGFLMGVFSIGRLMMGRASGELPTLISLAPTCAALILMMIPLGVGFLVLRKKTRSTNALNHPSHHARCINFCL